MVTAIQKHVCLTLKPRMVTGRHAGSASTCAANNLDFFWGGGDLIHFILITRCGNANIIGCSNIVVCLTYEVCVWNTDMHL